MQSAVIHRNVLIIYAINACVQWSYWKLRPLKKGPHTQFILGRMQFHLIATCSIAHLKRMQSNACKRKIIKFHRCMFINVSLKIVTMTMCAYVFDVWMCEWHHSIDFLVSFEVAIQHKHFIACYIYTGSSSGVEPEFQR